LEPSGLIEHRDAAVASIPNEEAPLPVHEESLFVPRKLGPGGVVDQGFRLAGILLQCHDLLVTEQVALISGPTGVLRYRHTLFDILEKLMLTGWGARAGRQQEKKRRSQGGKESGWPLKCDALDSGHELFLSGASAMAILHH
jgi:hypothetical protein